MYISIANKRRKYSKSPRKDYYNYSIDINFYYKGQKFIIIIFICIFCFVLFHNQTKNKSSPSLPTSSVPPLSFYETEESINFDRYEVDKYNEINQKIIDYKCSEMAKIHRKFINGIDRKYKPKKILELGVKRGGGSIVILNAINDFNESYLYSIDINTEEEVGECVNKYFPNLMKNWSLFKGNIAAEYMEKIGNNIDMVIIDTAHYEPGEILDFLIVLPFLKENAIAVFHDIGDQIHKNSERNEWAPYKIFYTIRGVKYFPTGKFSIRQDVGAVKLDSNQSKYYHDYFGLLAEQ